MRLLLSSYYLFCFIIMLIDCAPSRSDQPSSSTGLPGYARLKLKAHQRRHRQKHHNHHEIDELFDFVSTTKENAEENKVMSRKTKNTVNSKRERNEELCATERRTIDLNTQTEEYDPPFLMEIRCRNTADYEKQITDTLKEQTCVHNLLRCAQRYGEVHVSRRPIGAAHWFPHTLRNVPLGCDCMWPVDKYGHQEL